MQNWLENITYQMNNMVSHINYFRSNKVLTLILFSRISSRRRNWLGELFSEGLAPHTY